MIVMEVNAFFIKQDIFFITAPPFASNSNGGKKFLLPVFLSDYFLRLSFI